jgi:hypothetical protein
MAENRNLPDRIDPPNLDVIREPVRVLAPGVDAGFAPANPPGESFSHPMIAGWQVPPPAPPAFSPPVFGALSVIFGIAAFYKATMMLGPLAIVVGLIAYLRKQWGWGLIGILSAVAALAIDPYVWGLAGLYWLARVLGLLG